MYNLSPPKERSLMRRNDESWIVQCSPIGQNKKFMVDWYWIVIHRHQPLSIESPMMCWYFQINVLDMR